MACFGSIHLTITFLLCYLSLLAFIIFFIQPSSADKPAQLAHYVCKNTTNYKFCKEALYSDPRAPTADRFVLAYISFDLAYLNATNTRDFIVALIKNVSSNSHKRELGRHLERCRGHYGKAIRALAEAINDLDSETYYYLGDLAVEADHAASDCEASFNKGHSPLYRMNQNLRGLSQICVVVSKLFIVSS